MDDEIRPRTVLKVIGIVIVCLVLFWAGCSSLRFVKPGREGVPIVLGAVQPRTLAPGPHIVAPFITSVATLETREQKEQVEVTAASKDLQDVKSIIALNFHINPGEAGKLYQEIGLSYKERVIDPALQEAFKSATSKYTAEQLITRRDEVKTVATDLLKSRLQDRFISVNALSIVNFEFSQGFTTAIEQKQIAEQNALKASRDLDRIKIEAEQRIVQAQAEAESLRLQKDNLSVDLISLRQIELMKTWIAKWDGKMPMYMNGGDNAMFMMPLK
jgi:regulator of protease activity HflC (stomatin/prohibitin superfamily)